MTCTCALPAEQPGMHEPDCESWVRRCWVCGCTDDDCTDCVEATGEPCGWAEEDLCTRCEPFTDDSDCCDDSSCSCHDDEPPPRPVETVSPAPAFL